MKASLILGMLLILSSAQWAQGDGIQDCLCAQTVTLIDATCHTMVDCATLDGCEMTLFTASCTGLYTMSAQTNCTSGHCSDYGACVSVYENGVVLPNGTCHITSPCTGCSSLCIQSVCLIAGHQYKFYVCRTACDRLAPCPSPVTCAVTGKLSYCGPIIIECP
jgi:hypothetical protein